MAADETGPRSDRRDVAALGDARHEGVEGRHVLERIEFVHVLLDDHGDEAHAVVEQEGLGGEAEWLARVADSRPPARA